MWRDKIFKFKTAADAKTAKAKLDAWLERNEAFIQWEQIFVNNAYGVTYRGLVLPGLPR